MPGRAMTGESLLTGMPAFVMLGQTYRIPDQEDNNMVRQSKPKLRILLGTEIAVGPGKANLLEAIARSGSISAAAREMEMSYRRAWNLVEVMNQSFRSPLVETLTGGSGGGGALVTPMGMEVLARYRAMEHKAALAIAADMKDFQRLMKKSARS